MLNVTSYEILKQAAQIFKNNPDNNTQDHDDNSEQSFNFEAFLKKYDLPMKPKKDDTYTRYTIPCPFNSDHKTDASIWQEQDGKLCFHCFHDGCSGNGWKEFRAAICGDAKLDAFLNKSRTNIPSKSRNRLDMSFWDNASERFPRKPFPWDAFPSSIAESLKQVARSCATSDVAMPGAAMAIISSVLGRTVSVSPKKSWDEPLINWSADIRSSGEGKTPPVRLLLRMIYEKQGRTDERYETEKKAWEEKPQKARGAAPRRPGGHYATDLTLEGLRMDVKEGHGGLVCVLDELSSMISSQNQYKQKGNDREAWLSLWDGHDARISRASQATTIRGARISIFGGLQPAVFKMAFCGDNGIYLNDGTVFRFLFTYERDSFVPLTNESWDDRNRKAWESTLTNALSWADATIAVDGWEPHVLRLTDDAREYFQSYRNSLFEMKKHLPTPIQGFIPKAISYVLRIAGNLHCMRRFSCGMIPGQFLNIEEIKYSISVVEFYLAHTVSAMRLIEENISTGDINHMTTTLLKTLESLRNDLDSGRLAVGFIYKKFNALCNPTSQISSEKSMGALLREHNLTISEGKHDANGKRGVRCLIWDEKAEHFLRTLRTSHKQSLHEEMPADTGLADIADIADFPGEEYDIEGDVL